MELNTAQEVILCVAKRKVKENEEKNGFICCREGSGIGSMGGSPSVIRIASNHKPSMVKKAHQQQLAVKEMQLKAEPKSVSSSESQWMSISLSCFWAASFSKNRICIFSENCP